jgi:hypothetical protein
LILSPASADEKGRVVSPAITEEGLLPMNLSKNPTNGNGFRVRRTRPEHVALVVERVEHLTIEIHPTREGSGGETVVARVNGHDATQLGLPLDQSGARSGQGMEELRQHLADLIAARGGNGGSTA